MSFPTPWCTIMPLTAGPLVGNSYPQSITGLSASTIYEYRSYMVIDGTPYYGNVLTGCTSAIPTAVPTVCTGVINSIFLDGALVCSNKMCDDNNAPIAEYGILYTQQPSVSCAECLKYDKVPTWVCKQSTCGTIPDDTIYSGNITAMAANTTTYFRAFAKNAVGVGYGNVCSFVTCDIPIPIGIDVTIRTSWVGAEAPGYGFTGVIYLKCCTNTIVCTGNIPSLSYYCEFYWNVPAGCYFVDFNGLQAYCNSMSVTPFYFTWNDTYGADVSCETGCFSADNFVYADIASDLPL